MPKTWKVLFIIGIVSLKIFFQEAYAKGQTSACLVPLGDNEETLVTVFSQPNISSEILGEFYSGTNVTVSEFEKNGWAQISIGDTKALIVGYVMTSELAADEKMIGIKGELPIGLMKHDDSWLLCLYDAPREKAGAVASFPPKTLVIVLGHYGQWYYVNTGTAYGWMPMEQISLDDSYGTVRSFLDIPSMELACWIGPSAMNGNGNSDCGIPVEVIADMGELIQVRLNSQIFLCRKDHLLFEANDG